MLEAVGVFAITPIGGPARGLDIGRIPRLRANGTQEGGRMESAGADLKVQRLQDDAALRRPIILQGQNQTLEGGNIALLWCHADHSE